MAIQQPMVAEPADAPVAATGSCVVVLEQDFSKLDEAIANGLWEVDGDDYSLYVCEEGEGGGPAGAVLVAEGACGSQAELVHHLQGGTGARVTQLTVHLLCEDLDTESCGSFTVGLAFDEDFEEASLLALTLRRPRDDFGEKEALEGEMPPKPAGFFANGNPIVEDIGPLPVRVELGALLHWDETPRRVALQYRISPISCSEGGETDTKIASSFSAETTIGFYTTSVKFERATALCFRGTGTVKVRLLCTSCVAG